MVDFLGSGADNAYIWLQTGDNIDAVTSKKKKKKKRGQKTKKKIINKRGPQNIKHYGT